MHNMEPEETILQRIREIGYLTVTPLTITPSYYNIDNGTILKVFTLVDSIKPSPSDQGPNPRSHTMVTTFSPLSQHGPPSNVPLTQKQLDEGIIEEDVEVVPLREEFSVYAVSDGSTLSLKMIVGQVSKTKYFDVAGAPIYIVRTTLVPKVKRGSKN